MDQEKIKSNDKDIKVLRTYTSDMADAIKENEASVIKIALAEKEKREREKIYKEADGTKSSKIFFILGGIFLIILAIVGSTFLISKKEKKIPAPVVNYTETLIAIDSSVSVDITGTNNPAEILAKINQKSQTGSGLVRALFLTKTVNEVSENLKNNDFFSSLDINAPNSLVRSLTEKYLLGQYVDQNSLDKKTSFFLIFETGNYDQAYASLLSWEKNMLTDLSIFFNPNSQNIANVSKNSWKDIFINNKDARVLYNENGQALLYYGFIKNNFVITDNIEVFKIIINRLATKN